MLKKYDSQPNEINFIMVAAKPKEADIEININSDKQTEQFCPKCSKPKLPGNIECPYCGIVYSKFKTKQNPGPVKEPPPPPIKAKKHFKFPKINIKYEKEIVLFVSAGILFIYFTPLGLLAIICAIAYSVRGETPKEKCVSISDEIQPSQHNYNARITPYRFSGENIPDLIFKIKSSSRNTDYSVNPKHQTCTCPDFTDFRKQFEYGDVRRFCKHLMKAFCRKKIFPFVPDCIKPLIVSAKERGKGAFREQVFSFELNQAQVLLAGNENNEWYSIYTVDDGNEYRRFGYNMTENRWAYDKIPEHYREIISVIQTVKEST